MKLLSRVWRHLRGLVGREAIEDEIDREMRLHVELLAEEHERAGMPPEDARRAALRRFGNRRALVDRGMDVRRWTAAMIESILQDVRHGGRVLMGHPRFSVAVAATLALGIGITTAILATTHSVLIHRLPIEDEGRVVAVVTARPGVEEWRGPVSGVHFDEWRASADAFAGLAAVQPVSLDVPRAGGIERVAAELVSGSFFDVLGVAARHGRLFTEADERPLSGAVPCVVSESLWRRWFAEDPAVLDTVLTASGVTMTVVGVVPDAFARWRGGADVWVPFRLTPSLLSPDVIQSLGHYVLQVFGRLGAGRTVEQAHAQVSSLNAGLYAAVGDSAPGDLRVLPVRDISVDARVAQSLWLAGLTALVLLLLVSTNVAGLMLTRGLARGAEMQTRMALGATRTRLVRQRAVETMLLAAAGIGSGLLLGVWTVRLLASLAPPELSRTTAIALDGRVLAVAALATVVPMVAIATVSACLDYRFHAAGSRAALPRMSATGRTQAVLVGGQVTAAVPLMVMALLLVTSIVRLQTVDLGFQPRQLLRMSVALPPGQRSPDDASRFHRELLERIAVVPGVESAALGPGMDRFLAPSLPIVGISITIEGGGRFLNGHAEHVPYTPGRQSITPGYFRTIGLSLRQGRDFSAADRTGAPLVAIVNETMARIHWPGESLVGKRVSFDAVRPGESVDWIQIVGVVADARHNRVDIAPRPEIYLPLAQQPFIPSTVPLVVRGTGPAADLAEPVRRTVHSLSTDAPVFEVRTVASIIHEATATARYAGTVVALFAVLALALAASGIHGLGALAARQRARETGIRIALGARSADIVRLMLTHGLGPAVIGLLAGSALGILATRLIASLLYEVHPSDPVLFGIAAGALLIVAIVASLVPAVGAARHDPVSALKGP